MKSLNKEQSIQAHAALSMVFSEVQQVNSTDKNGTHYLVCRFEEDTLTDYQVTVLLGKLINAEVDVELQGLFATVSCHN